jgi:broad specificity phosphatase PhoE
VIDEVFAGQRIRQRRSAEVVGIEYQQSGLDWPEPILLDDLDEYDLDGLVNRLAPRLAQRNSDFAQLVENHRSAAGEQNRLRSFQRMFESLLRHWQTADSVAVDVESWRAFQCRIERVIRRIQDHSQRGRRAVLFTSGGFIGGATQRALQVSDEKALELNWRIRNSSVTEFVFTRERFSLDSFNMLPHLSDPALWTFR